MTDAEDSNSSLVTNDLDPIPVRRRRLMDPNSPPGAQDVIIIDSPVDLTRTRAGRRRRRQAQRNGVINQNAIVDLTCEPSPVVDLVDLTSSQERIAPIFNNSQRRRSAPPSHPTSVTPVPSQEVETTSSTPVILKLNCPVCLESLHGLLKKKVEIRSTVCGHVFCRNCITRSIRSNKKCPTCRRKLSEKQTHPLYLPIE